MLFILLLKVRATPLLQIENVMKRPLRKYRSLKGHADNIFCQNRARLDLYLKKTQETLNYFLLILKRVKTSFLLPFNFTVSGVQNLSIGEIYVFQKLR